VEQGEAASARGGGAPHFLHPDLSTLVCLPGFSEQAEFDANAAKSRFIERLGDSWQIAECRGKLIGIVVAGGKDARDAEADELRKHIEDFATSQVDVKENTVGAVLADGIHDVADFRNESHNLASEATKNQLQIEGDEALIFDNKNS